MSWLLFAFLTAFFESLKDLFSKLGLRHANEYIIAWSFLVFALPLLLPLILVTGIPELSSRFFMALFIVAGINASCSVLFMKAIKSSDLSITVPLVSFTPLFLLFTSPLILGEIPAPLGLIGVLFIVAGAYVLNIIDSSRGWLAPFRALFKQSGPRLMLLVAFLWSISANFDKIGIQETSPVFWAIAVMVVMTLLLTPVVIWQVGNPLRFLDGNYRALIPIGIFHGLTILSQMTAISMALVAYVIAIKRMSTALSVVWGALILKEAGFNQRITGVLVMLFGVLLITLS